MRAQLEWTQEEILDKHRQLFIVVDFSLILW